MNPQTHRVIFNKSRGCTMAVSEVASGEGKSKSGKSSSKRCKRRCPPILGLQKLNLASFDPSNRPLAQWIYARAAPKCIVLITQSAAQSETRFKQTGLTVSISNPVVSAVQGASQVARSASQTTNGRMQALAGAAAGLQGYNTYNALTDPKTGNFDAAKAKDISVSISLGTSKSQSNSSSTSNTARGSTVKGKNVSITATGGPSTGTGQPEEGNILIQGSAITATNNLTLTAADNLNLIAAQNTSSSTSTNSSSSGSIGVGISLSNPAAIGVTVTANRGRGNSTGQDTSYTNSTITAGNTASLSSGANTTIKGAIVKAERIKANVGGDLTIESPQDTSTYSGRQSSEGFSITVGPGTVGGSISASRSNINSTFASVNDQSGFSSGNGGFAVNVAGNTTLAGGVITSTQQAVDNNANSFTTGGSLSITDVANTASYSGNAASVSISAGTAKDPKGKDILTPGGSFGFGSTSGNASSISSAGITGFAGNTSLRTGNANTGLTRIFNQPAVQKELDAQVAVTAAFGSQASRAIGNYAAAQMDEAGRLRVRASNLSADDPERQRLQTQAESIEANWGDKGILRTIAHTVVGGLTGGLNGALGAATGTITAPLVAQALDDAGIKGGLAALITGVASTVAGGVVGGGVVGAATSFNEVTNNFLTPRENLARNKAAAACATSNFTDSAACGKAAQLNELDARRDKEINAAVAACDSTKNAAVCSSALNMTERLRLQSLAEERMLIAGSATSCPPPRDCTQLANWRSNELPGLNAASTALWTGAASGGVNDLTADLLLLLTPAAAARVGAWQLAKVPELYGSTSLRSYVWGGLSSGAIGTGFYTLTNLDNVENLTPGNFALAFGASAIGSGLVRRELNSLYGLSNTFIPFTRLNAVTQATGIATGYGTLGWMNSTNLPVTGNSVITQPIWPITTPAPAIPRR